MSPSNAGAAEMVSKVNRPVKCVYLVFICSCVCLQTFEDALFVLVPPGMLSSASLTTHRRIKLQ